jgi:hypothetical protein
MSHDGLFMMHRTDIDGGKTNNNRCIACNLFRFDVAHPVPVSRSAVFLPFRHDDRFTTKGRKNMLHRVPEQAILRSGQSLHLRVSRRISIVAVRGDLHLTTAPKWLGEQMLRPCLFLKEGCAHVVQDSGWISITAQTDAEVIFATERIQRSPFLHSLFALFALIAPRSRLIKRFPGRT